MQSIQTWYRMKAYPNFIGFKKLDNFISSQLHFIQYIYMFYFQISYRFYDIVLLHEEKVDFGFRIAVVEHHQIGGLMVNYLRVFLRVRKEFQQRSTEIFAFYYAIWRVFIFFEHLIYRFQNYTELIYFWSQTRIMY